MAQAALESSGPEEKALRTQLAKELLAIGPLCRYLRTIRVHPSDAPLDKEGWSQPWKEWLQETAQAESARIQSDFVTGIASALERNDLPGSNFLTRRFSAELGNTEWSNQQAFIAVKNTLCDSGRFTRSTFEPSQFADALAEVIKPLTKEAFTVVVDLVPVRVSSRDAKTVPKHLRPIRKRNDSGEHVLVAVEVDIDAPSADEAGSVALESVRKFLQGLRLIAYVRAHVSGAVKVVRRHDGAELWLSLPQPFWSGTGFRRIVPRLPVRLDQFLARKPEPRRAHWLASMWHLSQAFADWGEDCHSAASQVWQALEAFCGLSSERWRKVLKLIPEYINWTLPNMGEHIALGLALQACELRSVMPRCDWYVSRTRVSFEAWLAYVMDSKSRHYYRKWKSPAYPRIAFDPRVGLLHVVGRKLRDRGVECWMEERLAADVQLLYGLRNAVVHRGHRVLNRRMASYLGQTGAELLLAVMMAQCESTSVTEAR